MYDTTDFNITHNFIYNTQRSFDCTVQTSTNDHLNSPSGSGRKSQGPCQGNVRYLINGFEYFLPGFVSGSVPISFSLVPSRTR